MRVATGVSGPQGKQSNKKSSSPKDERALVNHSQIQCRKTWRLLSPNLLMVGMDGLVKLGTGRYLTSVSFIKVQSK